MKPVFNKEEIDELVAYCENYTENVTDATRERLNKKMQDDPLLREYVWDIVRFKRAKRKMMEAYAEYEKAAKDAKAHRDELERCEERIRFDLFPKNLFTDEKFTTDGVTETEV